jgi:hypothetical protein
MSTSRVYYGLSREARNACNRFAARVDDLFAAKAQRQHATPDQVRRAQADFDRVSRDCRREIAFTNALTAGLPRRRQVPVLQRTMSANVYDRFMIECAQNFTRFGK